jgi:hypothetical protein
MKISMKSSKLSFCLSLLALWLAGGEAPAQSYSIGGVVTDSTNGTTFFGVSGVTVTAKVGLSTNGQSAVTAANGDYTITNLDKDVDYGISPAKTGDTFSPASYSIEITSTSPTGVNFSVAHTISGQITMGGTGLSGVTVTADGFSVTTDTNGNYTITNVPAGTFATVPSLPGYFFIPPSQNVSLGPNATGVNFTAYYPSGIYIGGQVTSGTNGVSGVAVTAGTNLTTTGANGYYAFSNLPGVFLVTPSNAAQVFNPQHQALTATPGITTNINFAQGVSNITTIVATLNEPSLQAAMVPGGLVEFGSNGDLLITNTLTIATNLTFDGTNHQITLDGGGTTRIAAVTNSNVTFTLNNLTVSNGVVSNAVGSALDEGGAIYNNQGTLNISGCTFVGNGTYSINSGVPNGAYSEGGAIWNNGVLVVLNSTFIGNVSVSVNYTLTPSVVGGGAIANIGYASFQNCLFVSNGCLMFDIGKIGGGAIFSEYTSATESNTTLIVVNCTFSENSCVTNLFDANNSAPGSHMLNQEGSFLYVTNCTFQSYFTNNFAPDLVAYSSIVVRASIFYDTGSSFPVTGALTDAGFNLSSSSSSNSFTNSTSQNGVTNLNLSSVLAFNGGPTMTFNLLPGSPAIDVITNGYYPPTDQRGFIRPYGKAADIGAVEYYPSNFTIISLTRTNTNWTVQGYGFPLTTFQLLSSTNLTNANWSIVQTNATGSNGLFNILDTSSNAPRRFYRTAVP